MVVARSGTFLFLYSFLLLFSPRGAVVGRCVFHAWLLLVFGLFLMGCPPGRQSLVSTGIRLDKGALTATEGVHHQALAGGGCRRLSFSACTSRFAVFSLVRCVCTRRGLWVLMVLPDSE